MRICFYQALLWLGLAFPLAATAQSAWVTPAGGGSNTAPGQVAMCLNSSNQAIPESASCTSSVVAPAAGLGTDHGLNPPSTLTQLAGGTVTHAGQLYVMNESAATIQLWLQGATSPILIAPGAGANSQGADWSAEQYMPWFVGTFTINGATGSQFHANSN